ncbi:hypothetical protein NEMBOFW57_000937 [Staphylotrichum longicolle]|uniref:DUF6546 domain-containing protein n=1 Tax=Staphylotrichum longicolle TaxID=669026 RepID=A0AAD4F3L8_9PEZI|nr:hypothetical protein NEMBOFW57_000937 [Staphylotrichum longicolle]
MTYLPPEIVANIISHLTAKGSSDATGDNGENNEKLALAPYATVSRAWQQSIEATTFAHITLTPARLASPLAAPALTPDRVRRFVRSIVVHVALPPYDVEARARREDEADRAKNDAVFTEVVRRLFGLLAPAAESQTTIAGGQDGQQQPVRADANYRPNITLYMFASCVSDKENMDRRIHPWSLYGRADADIYEARWESSYLDLRAAAGKSVQDEAEALPELRCIQDILDESGGDKLSLAFHKLSQRLTSFDLIADVGPEILWPLEQTQGNDPLWPKMRRYNILHSAIAPSGQWRYLRSDSNDDGDDDDDEWDAASSETDPVALPGDEKEDHFRSKLDREAVDPLLLAAARAARRMPALSHMFFSLDEPAGAGRLEVDYTVKQGTAQLEFECHPLFNPDEEVLQIWRETEKEHVGAESGLVIEVKDSMGDI